MIAGKTVTLMPATLADRARVYAWGFQSETTAAHSGPPHYPDIEIPTYEAFCADYVNYFFQDSAPEKGRGYLILHGGEAVGFISYTSFHLKPYRSELDIWMSREAHCGKGLGTDAVATLAEYLNHTLGVREVLMRPSRRNLRAVAAYKKAGLKESDAAPASYLRAEYLDLYGDGDYGADESLLLARRFE